MLTFCMCLTAQVYELSVMNNNQGTLHFNTGNFSLDKKIEHIRKCDWICLKIQAGMEVGTTGWFRVQVLLLVSHESEKG